MHYLHAKRTCADALDSNSLGLLGARWERFLWLVEPSVEEGINERRFSQTRFTFRRQKQKRHDIFLTRRLGDVDDLPTTMAVN